MNTISCYAGTAAADSYIKDTTTQTFLKDVLRNQNASRCWSTLGRMVRPCKQLQALCSKSSSCRQRQGQASSRWTSTSIRPSPGSSASSPFRGLRVREWPPIDGFMGALPEAQVIAFIERVTKARSAGRKGSPGICETALAGGISKARRPLWPDIG